MSKHFPNADRNVYGKTQRIKGLGSRKCEVCIENVGEKKENEIN